MATMLETLPRIIQGEWVLANPTAGSRARSRALPMWRKNVSIAREQLTMLASFVDVFLAREGHDGVVGINLLAKVQLPNLSTLYGAMFAGVDYVIMGAGLPREIPHWMRSQRVSAPP